MSIDCSSGPERSHETRSIMMNEDNVNLQLRQPSIKFGADAEGVDPEHSKGLTHPRAYGTFPRILGKYVREERAILLENAIRKMTSAVAARLSIRDRSLLREGFSADAVIFDPVMIADQATFEKPHVRRRHGRGPRGSPHQRQARPDSPRAGLRVLTRRRIASDRCCSGPIPSGRCFQQIKHPLRTPDPWYVRSAFPILDLFSSS